MTLKSIKTFCTNPLLRVESITLMVLCCAGVPSVCLSATAPVVMHMPLPGHASLTFSDSPNAKGPPENRVWYRVALTTPDGITVPLFPDVAKPTKDTGTQYGMPQASDISPSGRYFILNRFEYGGYWLDGTDKETVRSTPYCSAVEIRSACIASSQTDAICGAGWQTGKQEIWGDSDQTAIMLTEDRPSSSRLLAQFQHGGARSLKDMIEQSAGVDNVLRCDPLTAQNRTTYQMLSQALANNGDKAAAKIIAQALNNASNTIHPPSQISATVDESINPRTTATIKIAKAILYSQPDDAQATRGYLVEHDTVSMIRKGPEGWVYIDYVTASGKHLLRWVKTESLSLSLP